jgi:hypothetical protein
MLDEERRLAGLIDLADSCQQVDVGGLADSQGFDYAVPIIHKDAMTPVRCGQSWARNFGRWGRKIDTVLSARFA